MVPENLSDPQFRAEHTGDDGAASTAPADHSDEAMDRLRHPFEAQPAAAATAAGAGEAA
jgi:hypothetical protein